jgi:hypothetical protein
MKECPDLLKAQKFLENNKKTKKTKKRDSVHLTRDDEDDDEDTILLCGETVMSSAEKILTPNKVLLDNQASIHLFYNKDLFSSAVRTCATPRFITGIGGTITVNKCATFEPFGEVLYAPECSANILSFSALTQDPSTKIRYKRKQNLFVVVTGEGQELKFIKDGGLFLRHYCTCAV